MEFSARVKMTDSKRRKSVTLETKIKALQSLNEKGVTASHVATDLGVHPSTVRLWKKQEELITEFVSHQDIHLPAKKARIRKPKNALVEQSLWIWFTQKRAAGIPLSGPLLRAQALKFHASLGGQDKFQASEGWLSGWKERHNIRCLSVCGEKLSADVVAAEKYKEVFSDLMKAEQLTADQVFNCDETGLNYRKIPQKTLSARSECGAPGMKGNKDRITVLACSNASGSLKLRLMVIGKSAKPRALKNVNILPVYYKNQKSAWMTSDLFGAWFDEEFVPGVTQFLREKGLPPKAVLLMDNCRAHPALKRGDIRCAFLPPNTTALIQPMDQGMLKCLKTNYSKKLMFSILENLDNGGNFAEHLKKINMKDVIFWIASAWDELPAVTIARSWYKLWPHDEHNGATTPNQLEEDDNNCTEQELQGTEEMRAADDVRNDLSAGIERFHRALVMVDDYRDITAADVSDWLKNPTQDREFLTDEEIVNMMSDEKENTDDFLENEVDSRSNTNMSIKEVKDSIERVIQYCDDNGNFTADNMIALHRIKDMIIQQGILNEP